MLANDTEIIQRVTSLAEALTACSRYLATAESCTGGLAAGACTAVSGSSAWFQGGVVAYDNAVKSKVLGVPETILEQYGAVSQETVQAMALGVCDLLDVSVGVAISGVAGPSGGTLEKPVGTVCIGVALDGVASSDIFHFAGDRAAVRRLSVLMALEMLLELLGHRQHPRQQAAGK